MSTEPELLRPAAYAKRIGCTRQAISKAINESGLIPTVEKNGKRYVNPSDPSVIEWERSFRERNPGRTSIPEIPEKPAPRRRSEPEKQEKQEPGRSNDQEIPPHIKALVDKQELTTDMVLSLPKAVIDKIKSYEQIKSIHQKRQQERRELVNVRSLRILFGKIYDIDINEFMTLKTRLKPHLSKIFQTNDDAILLEAEKVIDNELWEVLRRIKYEFNKYLERMKVDSI